MEVKSPCGITTAGGALFDATSKQRVQLISELAEKHRDLQESLRQKVNELRRLCLQEAELTGQVPAEYPLEYGERPPNVTRRQRGFRINVSRAEEVQLERLERDFALQMQMAEAARKLSLAAEQSLELTAEQRRKRRLVYLDALRRLQELEEQSNNLRRKLGLRPTHRVPHSLVDEAYQSECTSSESASYDDVLASGVRQPGGRLPEHSRAISSSPERRLGWKASPMEIYCEARNRRNSMASAASPTRSFPRSLSSLEGRSVPATPILSRNACSSSALRSEGSGLSQRQWSGSQDSQVGFVSDRPNVPASRNRRSNSSEALIERPPPSETQGKPSFKSSEALSERPQAAPAPSHYQPRGARSPDPRTPNANPRLPYEDILLDYYMERQQQQQQTRAWVEPEGHWWVEPDAPWWAEPDGSSHYSRRDGYYDGYPGSPALRSRAETQQRRTVARNKSCGPQLTDAAHFQQPWHSDGFQQRPAPQGSHPGPRSRSQPRAPPPEALERNVHKALALEGLRDWYLRNSAAPGGGQRGPIPSHMQYPRYYRSDYHEGHYQAGSPLPHSISFTGAPGHGRHFSEYVDEDLYSQGSAVSRSQGEQSAEGTPPGTLV